MKTSVIVIWLVTGALMIDHMHLFSPGSADTRFVVCAPACYSVPFLILLGICIPEEPSPRRNITLTLFVLILAFAVYLPCVWLIPDHHPSAFDGAVYFFAFPFLECGVIVLFLFVRSLISSAS
jgi:hypothetical protein